MAGAAGGVMAIGGGDSRLEDPSGVVPVVALGTVRLRPTGLVADLVPADGALERASGIARFAAIGAKRGRDQAPLDRVIRAAGEPRGPTTAVPDSAFQSSATVVTST